MIQHSRHHWFTLKSLWHINFWETGWYIQPHRYVKIRRLSSNILCWIVFYNESYFWNTCNTLPGTIYFKGSWDFSFNQLWDRIFINIKEAKWFDTENLWHYNILSEIHWFAIQVHTIINILWKCKIWDKINLSKTIMSYFIFYTLFFQIILFP